jgi:hypothetical protein
MKKITKRILVGVAAAVAVPVVVVGAYTAYIYIQLLIWGGRAVAMEYRISHADHKAVVVACREMLQNRREYSNTRTDWPTNGYDFVDFNAGSIDSRIPKVIRDLHPCYAQIDSNSVSLLMMMEADCLLRYTEGGKEHGVKLAEGLWRINLDN